MQADPELRPVAIPGRQLSGQIAGKLASSLSQRQFNALPEQFITELSGVAPLCEDAVTLVGAGSGAEPQLLDIRIDALGFAVVQARSEVVTLQGHILRGAVVVQVALPILPLRGAPEYFATQAVGDGQCGVAVKKLVDFTAAGAVQTAFEVLIL